MLEVNNLFHATRIIEGYGVIETTGTRMCESWFWKSVGYYRSVLASSEHYKN